MKPSTAARANLTQYAVADGGEPKLRDRATSELEASEASGIRLERSRRQADESVLVHEHAARDHIVVRITDLGLEPQQRILWPEQAVVWLNYSHIAVRISLEPDSAKRTACREPSHFEVAENRALQASLVGRFDSASLCLLRPGRYRYVVEELDTVERPIRPRPEGRRFEGVLEVLGIEGGEPKPTEVWRLALYHRTLALRELALARFYDQLVSLYQDAGEPTAAERERNRARNARSAAAIHEEHAREFERTDEDAPVF